MTPCPNELHIPCSYPYPDSRQTPPRLPLGWAGLPVFLESVLLELEGSRGIDGGDETNEERLRVRWQLRLHLVHLRTKERS